MVGFSRFTEKSLNSYLFQRHRSFIRPAWAGKDSNLQGAKGNGVTARTDTITDTYPKKVGSERLELSRQRHMILSHAWLPITPRAENKKGFQLALEALYNKLSFRHVLGS